ncbi:homolog of Synechocystis YCF37 [Hibiscus trionum]|uniref:Homolog of Synechocystis YCF37 n=1 Tax=Hibiscus trionum TaxID=183268 RepID=A0A9W7H0L3_HIBTR|nr:homolog of Synechocystis YCF37 [Hibiscus trionum]
MASTISPPMLHSLSVHCAHTSPRGRSVKAHVSKPAPSVSLSNRRQLLFSLATTTALTVSEKKANAEDIPLFGFRKKLKKAEEEAVEIVKEGLVTAEKGLVTAEKEIFTAEKKIETAEKEIGSAVSFGALAQAGTVAGAEFLGVVVATSIVNGILAAEAPKS